MYILRTPDRLGHLEHNPFQSITNLSNRCILRHSVPGLPTKERLYQVLLLLSVRVFKTLRLISIEARELQY